MDGDGNAGIGRTYGPPVNLGCTSGVRMTADTFFPELGSYGWCVPTEACASRPSGCVRQCSTDADCPLDSTMTMRWTCNPPAKNEIGTNSLRLCRPKLGQRAAPYCDMR